MARSLRSLYTAQNRKLRPRELVKRMRGDLQSVLRIIESYDQ